MKQEYASEGKPSRSDRIRQLGFDPTYLTSSEQQELLEIESRLAVGGRAVTPKPALAR
ncbi:MAG: hypothetical protein WD766_08225 [Gemmatimonadota bacterium]